MHQTAELDPDLELLHRITEQRREIARLEAVAEESATKARSDKDALKRAQKALQSLLDETIADRPLFARPVAPVAIIELTPAGAPVESLEQLLEQESERDAEEAAERPLCPDCGGFLDQPTPRRHKNSRTACHLGRDGKARKMKTSPEEVRAKREHPPEVVRRNGDAFREADERAAAEKGDLVFEDWRDVGVHDLELSAPLASALDQLGLRTAGALAEWLEQVDADEDDGATVSERFNWGYRDEAVNHVRAALHQLRKLDAPEPPPRRKPALWLVLHGPDDGPFERVCLVEADENSHTEAIEKARARIAWQVANFEHGLVLGGPGPDMSWRIAAAAEDMKEAAWLEKPLKHERSGQSIRGNGKDRVPLECPEGEPRLYEVAYHHGRGKTTVLCTIKATCPKDAYETASHWLSSHRPAWTPDKLELRPIDEATARKRAKQRSKIDHEFRRETERDDWRAQARVEMTTPDPEPEGTTG